MYKLIAIDLDGTLLDDNKDIPKDNIKLVQKLIDKGYEIVIATGRRYWSAKQLTKDIDRSIVILANNGNIVRNTKDDELIIKKYLGLNDFKTLIKNGRDRGLHPIIHIDNYNEGIDMIIEMDRTHRSYHNYIGHNEERYKRVSSFLDVDDDRILAIVYAGDKKTLEAFYLDIKKLYPDKYSSHIVENIRVAEALLEIMNPLGCKWLSLKEYAKDKGIDEAEIIAIGDDNNDAQMIKNAGCGIAMKNSGERVMEVADIITEKDNNESGVAFELRKVLNL